MNPGFFSLVGRLGAQAFWRRYHSDPIFREEMTQAWKKQRFDSEKKRKAAKKGAEALWRRYHADPAFKELLDRKLSASRSRGGSIALRNLGEQGFKRKLATNAPSQLRPQYRDSQGNVLRSTLELTVAHILEDNGIRYYVEPRFVIGDHAFYPDFILTGTQKIIEAVGYMGDRYWDGTARKVRLIIGQYPEVHVAILTSFGKTMAKRLIEVPRVRIFSPYQANQLVRWCRGEPGFT